MCRVDKVAVRDEHSFWPTGRARGVDDVCEVVERRAAGQVPIRLESDRLPLAIDADDRGRRVGEPVKLFLLRQQDRDLGVLKHESEPLGGIGRVERHIGAARLENGQESNDHLRRTASAQAHQHLGADAQGSQAAGQPVGPAIELGIRERLAGASHGNGLRGPSRLHLDPAVDTVQVRRGSSCQMLGSPRQRNFRGTAQAGPARTTHR